LLRSFSKRPPDSICARWFKDVIDGAFLDSSGGVFVLKRRPRCICGRPVAVFFELFFCHP
ncbi:MAG TPA: hypothetical protein VNX46_11105, partial [Candidatus Acidoferrum sp.]|nr:hypothetical protein [Candidatus Acidoferrum sp.]